MENVGEIKINPIDIFQEDLYRCEKCEKVFKIKSSLSRHLLQKHGQVDLLKLKLKNEHLSLKVDLYLEQIKFLKDLIIIQESFQHEISVSILYISSMGLIPLPSQLYRVHL